MTPGRISPGLVRAYRAAVYRVDGPGGPVTVRIGSRSPDLDRRLARVGAARAAIVTAANPRSRRRSDTVNRIAGLALLAAAHRLGVRTWPATALDPDARWPAERGLCLLGPSDRAVDRLLHRFGQNAAVTIVRGRPARLHWRGHAGRSSPALSPSR